MNGLQIPSVMSFPVDTRADLPVQDDTDSRSQEGVPSFFGLLLLAQIRQPASPESGSDEAESDSPEPAGESGRKEAAEDPARACEASLTLIPSLASPEAVPNQSFGRDAESAAQDGGHPASSVRIPAPWTGSAQTSGAAAGGTAADTEPAGSASAADLVSYSDPAKAESGVRDGLAASASSQEAQAAHRSGAAPASAPAPGAFTAVGSPLESDAAHVFQSGAAPAAATVPGMFTAADSSPESIIARVFQSGSEAEASAAPSEATPSGSLVRAGAGDSDGGQGGETESAARVPGDPAVQTLAARSVQAEATPEKNPGETEAFQEPARRTDAGEDGPAAAALAGGTLESADHTVRIVENDPDALFNRIMERIDPVALGRGEALRIVLEPDELGSVTIRMETTGQGVSVRILADNHQVRQALEGGLGQLAKSLRECGVTPDSIRVEAAAQSENDAQPHSGAFLSDPRAGSGRQYRPPFWAGAEQADFSGPQLPDPGNAPRLNLYG